MEPTQEGTQYKSHIHRNHQRALRSSVWLLCSTGGTRDGWMRGNCLRKEMAWLGMWRACLFGELLKLNGQSLKGWADYQFPCISFTRHMLIHLRDPFTLRSRWLEVWPLGGMRSHHFYHYQGLQWNGSHHGLNSLLHKNWVLWNFGGRVCVLHLCVCVWGGGYEVMQY